MNIPYISGSRTNWIEKAVPTRGDSIRIFKKKSTRTAFPAFNTFKCSPQGKSQSRPIVDFESTYRGFKSIAPYSQILTQDIYDENTKANWSKVFRNIMVPEKPPEPPAMDTPKEITLDIPHTRYSSKRNSRRGNKRVKMKLDKLKYASYIEDSKTDHFEHINQKRASVIKQNEQDKNSFSSKLALSKFQPSKKIGF